MGNLRRPPRDGAAGGIVSSLEKGLEQRGKRACLHPVWGEKKDCHHRGKQALHGLISFALCHAVSVTGRGDNPGHPCFHARRYVLRVAAYDQGPRGMSIDLEHLFRLRLAIARFGEMDGAKWWNTKLIGRLGAMTLSRGLPRSHEVARARAVFAVARDRCAARFSRAKAVTLWNLPATIEDEFDGCLTAWLADLDQWRPFISQMEAEPRDLILLLKELEIIREPVAVKAAALSRTDGEGAINLGTIDLTKNDDLSLLAAAFATGGTGDLVVPFASLEAC